MPFRSAKRLSQFLLVTAIYHTILSCDQNFSEVSAQTIQEASQTNGTSWLVDRTFTEATFSSSSSPPVRESDCGMPFGFFVREHRASEGGGMVYRYPQVPLDVENYPVAPTPLQLEQVHVFVRHGASLVHVP